MDHNVIIVSPKRNKTVDKDFISPTKLVEQKVTIRTVSP